MKMALYMYENKSSLRRRFQIVCLLHYIMIIVIILLYIKKIMQLLENINIYIASISESHVYFR